MSAEDPKSGIFTLPDGTQIEVDINPSSSKTSPGTYKIDDKEIVVESETPKSEEQ